RLETDMPELFTPYESGAEQANANAFESKLTAPVDLTHDFQTQREEKIEDPAPKEELALAQVPGSADWSSAPSAREFLEQLAEDKPRGALARFWDTRRGDIYLAVAVILVACVIRWGIWSNHPVSATNNPNTPNITAQGRRKPTPVDPAANLSLFD